MCLGMEKGFRFQPVQSILSIGDLHFSLKQKGLEAEIDLLSSSSAFWLTLSAHCKQICDWVAQRCPCTPNLSALGFQLRAWC